MKQNKRLNIFNRFFKKNRITTEQYQQIEDPNTPPPQLDITYADSRSIINFGLIIIALFFGVGGTWVSLAEIGGAVIAPGEIRIDSERKTVQHLEGGIIKQILVRNGDHVKVGQPLIVLDSSRLVAATDQLRLQLAAAQLDNLRYEAEKTLSDQVNWPVQNASIPDYKFHELLDSTTKVFSSGRQSLQNQINLLSSQIEQLYQQDSSLNGRLQAEQQIIAALQEELDAKNILFKQQYIDKTSILSLRRAIAEHQGITAQFQGSQAELRERVAEFRLRINAIQSDYRQHAIEQQAQTQQRLFDLQQQLLPLQDARQRLTIKAPVAGVVVALKVHSKGGVVRAGEPLLDIVPKDSHLIVICNVQIKDIAHIYTGQQADVQLSAFPRNTPKIHGKLTYISADRILTRTPRGEMPSYEIHIELDAQQLAENDLQLTAGMPAAVFIRTKLRTVLTYALEPLTDNFDRAMREN